MTDYDVVLRHVGGKSSLHFVEADSVEQAAEQAAPRLDPEPDLGDALLVVAPRGGDEEIITIYRFGPVDEAHEDDRGWVQLTAADEIQAVLDAATNDEEEDA